MSDNPFDTPASLAHSRLFGLKQGKPVLLADPATPPDLFASAVAGAFKGFVQAPQFSCVGAKSAVTRENYRLGVYEQLGSLEVTAGLARDLFTYAHEAAEMPLEEFFTFAAIFKGPTDLDEQGFEAALWEQLRQLNLFDAPLFPWDPTVSSDPESPHFSFSFAGRAFFVVGLHPNSSREARQFPWPTLVFNSHAQFVHLREDGRWDRLQQTIRDREESLQGSLNPNLANHGDATEARQYSGREVEPDWHPPFEPANADGPAAPSGCPFAHLHGGKAHA